MQRVKTDVQLVDMVYLILKKNYSHFKESLMRWNKLRIPPAEDYAKFKEYMPDEHAEFEQVEGLTMDNSSLNTNLL